MGLTKEEQRDKIRSKNKSDLDLIKKESNKSKSKLIPGISGIYFLKHNKETVYIGESSCILARIGQHSKSTKVFDDYSWFEVNDGDLARKRIESSLINKHKPKYNKTLKKSRKKKSTYVVYGERIIFKRP